MHAKIQGVDRSVRPSDIGVKLSGNKAFSSHADNYEIKVVGGKETFEMPFDKKTTNGLLENVYKIIT